MGLYNGVFTMVDDVTHSVWSHLTGQALDGPQAGAELRVLPLQTTTWEAWVAEHPDTTALDRETGYEQRYGEMELGQGGLDALFLSTLDGVDPRLPESTLLIGVLAGSEAYAFPVDATPLGAPMQAEVGGVPVVILEDSLGAPALAYHRALSDGRVLTFERDGSVLRDVQTGSAWSSTGLAVSGQLAGVQLTFVTSLFTEWYGWAAFHPRTKIYGVDG